MHYVFYFHFKYVLYDRQEVKKRPGETVQIFKTKRASQFSISFWCRAPFCKSVSIYGMNLKLGPVIDRDKRTK